MIGFLLRTAIFLGAAAIGLLVAAALIDGVEVTPSGFVLVVVIYAVAQSVLSPFVVKLAAAHARTFLGGASLVSTFLALVVASVFGDALDVTGGPWSWVGATVVVWLVTALASVLLPVALVKAGVERARSRPRT